MTAIRPFAAGAYAAQRNTAQVLALKSQLGTLTTQLATGRASETYGGLGSGRTTALSAHATLSAIAGYGTAITAAQTRTKLAVASLTQVAGLGTATRNSLQNGLQNAALDSTANATLAANNLDAALDALNQRAGEAYLFGGRDAATQPVLGSDAILNGTTTATGAKLAGLKTLVADQVGADVGAAGTGRLALARPGATSVSLTEDAGAEARANFGFSLKASATTGSALTASITPATAATATPSFQAAPSEGQRFRVVVNQADGSQRTIDFTARADPAATDTDTFPVYPDTPAGRAEAGAKLSALVAPATLASVQSAAPSDAPPGPGLSLAFSGGSPASLTVGLGTPAAQPAVGDTLTLTLALHDGTTTTLTLKAAATSEAGSTATFAIGADAAATATNLATTLEAALKSAAGTTLTVSATARAAQDFFAGSATAGLAPRRIAFDADGEATGYRQTPAADTVIWYAGDDSGGDPRATQTALIGATATVQVGARANEAPIRSVLAGLATVALGLPKAGATGTGTTGAAVTLQAVAARAGALLGAADTSPSVQDVATDLSLASARMTDAAATNTAVKAALQDSLDGVEQVSTEEVATRLLDLQNRLQASYQITASLSKLSLVNYMS